MPLADKDSTGDSSTERPILFSAPMVRAILEGRKTQTRRIVKPYAKDGGFVLLEMEDGSWWPYRSDDGETASVNGGDEIPFHCRYGIPGDRLWVRETTIIAPPDWNDGFCANAKDRDGKPRLVQYLATHPDKQAANDYRLKATPSIHMPRWASRITLEVTGVRVERLQDISAEDAKAEGVQYDMHEYDDDVHAYRALWEQINGLGSWDANPFVWVVEFKPA